MLTNLIELVKTYKLCELHKKLYKEMFKMPAEKT